jgi:hypothetical protein
MGRKRGSGWGVAEGSLVGVGVAGTVVGVAVAATVEVAVLVGDDVGVEVGGAAQSVIDQLSMPTSWGLRVSVFERK